MLPILLLTVAAVSGEKVKLGDIQTLHHAVSGEVFALDDKTLMVQVCRKHFLLPCMPQKYSVPPVCLKNTFIPLYSSKYLLPPICLKNTF